MRRARPSLPLMIPVIIMGGILTGWFTPTEAGMVASVYILVVLIPLLNRGHIPQPAARLRLHRPALLHSAGAVAGASAFGWMLAYLRGPDIVAGWIADFAGTDGRIIMLLLVLLFIIIGDFMDAVPAIIIFMPIVNKLTELGNIKPAAHGRGADHHPGVRADHAALRAVAAGGVEIRRRAVSHGDVRVAADLCRVLRHHRLHGAVPRRRALSAEAAAAGVGRLLQEPERHRLHLPAASLFVRQRDEFRIARHLGEAAVAPVGLGLLDALLGGRHEVPPD